MFAGRFGKVFHFHLKKSGGTSLNSWLNCHQPDDRMLDDTEALKLLRRVERFNRPMESAAQTAFFTSDVIGTHLPLRVFAPDDTFSITILRDPRQRVLSQVADWRREARTGYSYSGSPEEHACPDSVSLPLAEFLEKYARSDVGFLLDNYMTRALAAGHTDEVVEEVENVETLLPVALNALEQHYHVVGLTSRLTETRAAIASSLGLVHDPHYESSRNATGSNWLLAAEVDSEVNNLLDRLTAHDQILLDRAVELFEERHSFAAMGYDETEFETRHASTATKRLRLIARDGFAVATVKDIILGSGHWGRDAAGTPECCVWTGPATRTVLYLPCLPDLNLSIRVWIRGYAAERLRSELRFEIDDIPRTHSFQQAAGWFETATIRARSTRPFLKIAMQVNGTIADEIVGDDRRRGVAFDSYGWAVDPN